MYINYQPQHMSFRSREKQSYLKRSVQLRSSLQFVNISWRESSTGPVNEKFRLRKKYVHKEQL